MTSVTDHVDAAGEQSVATPGAPPTSRPTRPLAWLAVPVLGGWALSWILDLLSADVLMLPVLVLAIASVLRTGRNFLDRIMLSSLTLAGLLVAGGVLFSFWPWGLSPMPVGGALFTVVAVVAWLSNRRPQFARGFELSDLLILGTGLFGFVAAARPVWGLSSIDRLLFTTTSEDRSNHFALFDSIHAIGGYPFLRQDEASQFVQAPTEAVYPTGTHFLYAMMDIFGRSTTATGAALDEFSRYFFFVITGFAFLLMITVWAARWALGHSVAGWRRFFAVSVVAALVIGGPLATILTAGFDSEVLGIAFVAFIVAVAIRPARAIGERIVLLGAGAVLIAYTYYLYLPFVAVAIVACLLVSRRQLRGHWPLVIGGAVLVGGLSLLPLISTLTSDLDVGAQAVVQSGTIKLPLTPIMATTLATLAFLVTLRRQRPRRLSILGLILIGSIGFIGLFGLYQKIKIGSTSYYFEKLLTCLLVIALIGLPVLVTLLRPLQGWLRQVRRPALVEAAVGVLAAIVAFTAIAGFQWGVLSGSPLGGDWRKSSLGEWYGEEHTSPVGPDLIALAQQGKIADGKTTLFLLSNIGYLNWRVTFTNSTLNRDAGDTKQPVNVLLRVNIGGPLAEAENVDKSLAMLRNAVLSSDTPVQLVVRDPDTAALITERLSDLPAGQLSVVTVK